MCQSTALIVSYMQEYSHLAVENSFWVPSDATMAAAVKGGMLFFFCVN